MASPVEAILLLCDSAVAEPNGKVHMLGAGWSSVASIPTPPCAVVAMLKVPWDRANEELPLHLALLNSDGDQVALETPDGAVSIGAQGNVEVGRPPGIAKGSSLDSAFVLNLGPLPLAPGRYEWRLTVADQDSAHVAFQVIAPR